MSENNFNTSNLTSLSSVKERKNPVFAAPLRTDQIRRSSSPLISQNCLSQIIRCNFPVSEHTSHSAILIKKMTTILFPLKFPNSAAFLFSWESLAETPFCFFFLLNQCCFSSASRRALRVLAAEWAESVAAMGRRLAFREAVSSRYGKPITA